MTKYCFRQENVPRGLCFGRTASEVGEALRRQVSDRAHHVCEYCLVHQEDVYHGCEVDHIRSVKHGGLTVVENLAFACFHCNRRKGTDLGLVGVRTRALVQFYDPRKDKWMPQNANKGWGG